MSRTVPWRNKPTTLITQMIPVSNQYKLYLVNQSGPTSFVFKDDNDNKFKVSIGSTVQCSCGIVQNDHCIHTLYVMLKKFKVPPTNSIIWQASYLDSELEGLVQLKYAEKRRQQRKKHEFKRTMQQKNINQQADDFPPLQEDSMCPICYEQMNGECYSTCKTCKKSLHTKCFKIWTKHKQDSNLAVTCPMCRSEFQNPMVMIYKDLERWESRFSTHKGTHCRGCGLKNIKGLLYKCLLCSGVELCKMCFEGNQHSEHERFFVKQNTNEEWKAAPIRIKKTRKQLFQPIRQVNTKQLPELRGQQFIMDLFPTLKDYSSLQQDVQLGIIGNQILPKQMCFKCKTAGNQLMKRLNCGHCLHDECLRSMLIHNQYICQLDNGIFCPGYFQALGIKIQKQRKTVESVILKNQQETNRITNNINQFEINGFITKNKPLQKRANTLGTKPLSHNKSKDKNFRIMKKTVLDKKTEDNYLGMGNLGMIMITGLGHQTQQNTDVLTPHTNGSTNYREQMHLPPRMRGNLQNVTKNRRLQQPF